MDAEGCESDTVHIALAKSDLCRLVIYDAFSPNGDSYNEEWIIGNIENYPSCTVRVSTPGACRFSAPPDILHPGWKIQRQRSAIRDILLCN
jgi:hypothetical protein